MNQELTYDFDAVMPAAVDTGTFRSLFTAQAPTGAMGPSGAPTGDYADVAGLVNIVCMAPPESTGTIDANEVKAIADVTATAPLHVLLDNYYPALHAGWRGEQPDGTGPYQAVIAMNDGFGNPIDPVVYDILGVETSSQFRVTRVKVRLATV
jgi:hypothetical protein